MMSQFSVCILLFQLTIASRSEILISQLVEDSLARIWHILQQDKLSTSTFLRFIGTGTSGGITQRNFSQKDGSSRRGTQVSFLSVEGLELVQDVSLTIIA
jgi:hypothetical protein